MDKRRKSTKEVDGDGDDDGVSLSIMKMAQQGEVEKRSDRRRCLSGSPRKSCLDILSDAAARGPTSSKGRSQGTFARPCSRVRRRRERREAFDANGISAPFSKSGHHLDGERVGAEREGRREWDRTIFLLSQSSFLPCPGGESGAGTIIIHGRCEKKEGECCFLTLPLCLTQSQSQSGNARSIHIYLLHCHY